MDILKELESLDFDSSIYTEKSIKNCTHNEKVALMGTIKVTSKKTKTGNPYYILTIWLGRLASFLCDCVKKFYHFSGVHF